MPGTSREDSTVASARIPGRSLSRRQLLWGVLVLAAGLRLPGLWTDFWLDEIWSWTLVWSFNHQPRISGILGIFTEIHQDNNNYLNTLFLYLCGPAAPLAVYRIPPFFAGILTVWFGSRLAVRWNQGAMLSGVAATLAGTVLLATSQVEVVYSSEARGYAIAGCAALAGQWWMGQLLESGKWRNAGIYAAVACVGFLGHLSFLPVFISQAVWGLAVVTTGNRPTASRRLLLGQIVLSFGIPTAMIGWLWLVDLSQAIVGGGPELNRLLVARDTFAMPFGASLPEDFALPCGLLMLAMLLTGLWNMRRLRTLEIVSLASLTVIAPTVMFGLAPQGLVYPRHFLVSLTLLMPVAGIGVIHWLRARRASVRLLAFLSVALWCGTNSWELMRFWSSGRGQYQAALDQIASSTSGRLTGVGSDFDFRTSMIMLFYQSRSRQLRTLRFIPQEGWSQYRPEWLILHAQGREPQFTSEIEVLGYKYARIGVFPFAGPIGFHWATYHLAGPAKP